MKDKGILSKELLNTVIRKVIADDNNIDIRVLEPNVNEALDILVKHIVKKVIDLRIEKSQSLSAEELVKLVVPISFTAGLISERIARDILDMKKVDNISEYFSTLIPDEILQSIETMRK